MLKAMMGISWGRKTTTGFLAVKNPSFSFWKSMGV